MEEEKEGGELAKKRCSQALGGSRGEVMCRRERLTSGEGCGKASKEGSKGMEVTSKAGANVP